jgi:light-regulated signal transduction histidine kinase (bacteriophytochrome)
MAKISTDLSESEQISALQAQNQKLLIQAAQLEEQLRQESSRAVTAENELDAMLHYISHDLRAPLRGIDGYCRALLEDYNSKLDQIGKAYLQYICESSAHLNQLIEGLLRYSRVIRNQMEINPADLSEMAIEISQDLQRKQPERQVEFRITPGIIVNADIEMAYTLLRNLLENAYKFTSKHATARIEFGQTRESSQPVCFVRDDGAGFDMAYLKQLFLPFQRLHGQHEFEGIGLGLATAQRIVQRHNGQIWAEGAPEQGAIFHFVLNPHQIQ